MRNMHVKVYIFIMKYIDPWQNTSFLIQYITCFKTDRVEGEREGGREATLL